MNILQHKSWHVYSQKNQDKVRKDEAKAEAGEKQIQERALAADREHRLAILRQRAQHRTVDSLGAEPPDNNHAVSTIGPPTSNDTKALTITKQQVNFWPDLEHEGAKNGHGNPEYEAEVKVKQEKWNRTIAIHLDTGISKEKTPWYARNHAVSMSTSRRKEDNQEFSKIREDPMNVVKSMLDKRDKNRRDRSRSASPTRRTNWLKNNRARVQDLKNKPETNTMARLRKERLEREEAERAKARALLNPAYVDPKEHYRPVGTYSQQYNPQDTTLAHSLHARNSNMDRPHESHGYRHERDTRRDKDRERHSGRDYGIDEDRDRHRVSDKDYHHGRHREKQRYSDRDRSRPY
ncbi:hypothetical protein BC939DRAFT_460434 [Gamsiella multidivaricata]|uniref:uncharacterized protein n=1 Tax=Gamsiella multidivaricata TaxID=101098 RepID=UPI00221FF888|nr:uncharacterized protein BC939DRAFT_460434 [Gamsiella multidivaricata]KAI7819327.1 hypothetical protein BC939DRAFT_460434 [Gamsiella multidivaricata]